MEPILFLAPEIQTCTVWKYDGLIRLEQRPVPLILHHSDANAIRTPYTGWSTGLYLNDGVELFRSESKIVETHLDGTQYVWYNPDYIVRCALKSDDSGMRNQYIRLFADGSMKARLDMQDYFWSAPVMRPYVPYPCKDIIYFRDQGFIDERSEYLNYDMPHAVDCLCLRCAESPVKPVFEHSGQCKCDICVPRCCHDNLCDDCLEEREFERERGDYYDYERF